MTQPAAIPDLRPSRRIETLWEELDGEIVAWSPQGDAVHLLDSHATAVFLLLDGTRTVADVAALLSARFHADPATVARDVEELTVRLSDLGLVGLAEA